MLGAAGDSICRLTVAWLLCVSCWGAAAVLVSAAGAAAEVLVAGSPLPTAIDMHSTRAFT
jgi:hypothetical protein